MSNVVKMPAKGGTVARVLDALKEDEESISNIVVVVQKKNGKTTTAWSTMDTMQLAYFSRVLEWELDHQFTEATDD